eukprot:TRINITY_DN14584_c0_g1_i1.p2 TRINITY_DN14584_c0_g1~~TRINITY_DN14584_c0_g1_i1.p2  ORF type:complete len:341 (+),score=94.57 TRINITY_DN14584_c0_g1_i1:84-1106(+)
MRFGPTQEHPHIQQSVATDDSAYGAALDVPAEDVAMMTKITEFFGTRLVRKEHRHPRPLEDPDSALYAAVQGFRKLVYYAYRVSRHSELSTEDWEQRCSEFTEAHKGICHWCCPVRLGDYLTQNHFPIHWAGAVKERKKPPPREKAAKDSERPTAQPFWCPHCSVLCNSLAQTVIHVQGQRHREQMAGQQAFCQARGIPFVPQPPQPVDPQLAPPRHTGNPTKGRARGDTGKAATPRLVQGRAAPMGGLTLPVATPLSAISTASFGTPATTFFSPPSAGRRAAHSARHSSSSSAGSCTSEQLTPRSRGHEDDDSHVDSGLSAAGWDQDDDDCPPPLVCED